MLTKMWDCVVVKCPSCDAEVGQRCRPLRAPYKVRSKRKEVDAPHVCRLNAWRHKRKDDEVRRLMEDFKY